MGEKGGDKGVILDRIHVLIKELGYALANNTPVADNRWNESPTKVPGCAGWVEGGVLDKRFCERNHAWLTNIG